MLRICRYKAIKW